MNSIIKKYELSSNVTTEDLLKNGFKYSEKGCIKDITTPRYHFIKYLTKDFELLIEIGINEDGTLLFDDEKHVLLLDDDFCQPYGPFYDEVNSPIVNDLINKYNEVMDKFVENGIMREKDIVKKEEETDKNRLDYFGYRSPVSIEKIPDSQMNNLETNIQNHLDYEENCRARGRVKAGQHIAGGSNK